MCRMSGRVEELIWLVGSTMVTHWDCESMRYTPTKPIVSSVIQQERENDERVVDVKEASSPSRGEEPKVVKSDGGESAKVVSWRWDDRMLAWYIRRFSHFFIVPGGFYRRGSRVR